MSTETNGCEFCGHRRNLKVYRENKAGGFKRLRACLQCVTGMLFSAQAKRNTKRAA